MPCASLPSWTPTTKYTHTHNAYAHRPLSHHAALNPLIIPSAVGWVRVDQAAKHADLLRATEVKVRSQLKVVDLDLVAATTEIYRGKLK